MRQGDTVTVLDEFNDYYDPAIKRANVAGFQGQANIIEGDLRDRPTVDRVFAEGKFDTVIHLAARAGVRPSIDDPALYLATNINGTFHLLEAAKATGVPRFVFASSSSVYGINKKVPFAETDRIEQTISPYAMTKMAGEQMCSNYTNLYNIRTVCLRFFTVYGPRQRPDMAFHRFIEATLDGGSINVFGDGEQTRDFTFIADIVEANIAAAAEGVLGVFNIGGGSRVTLRDVLGTLAEVAGPVKQNRLEREAGDVLDTWADVSAAVKAWGYAPKVALREGLTAQVAWHRERRARLAR